MKISLQELKDLSAMMAGRIQGGTIDASCLERVDGVWKAKTNPYQTIIDMIRERTSVNGHEVIKERIVRIKIGDTYTNEYLGFDGSDYFFLNDWYEGGIVELVGFIDIDAIDIPEC